MMPIFGQTRIYEKSFTPVYQLLTKVGGFGYAELESIVFEKSKVLN